MSRDETFDLQSHSTHSDGSLTPREVVRRAVDAGVRLLALTDHDTVDGVSTAVDAARAHGIAVTPAVELSSVGAGREDLHILGYGIDHTDPALLAALEDFRQDRNRRIHAMADRLREHATDLAVSPSDFAREISTLYHIIVEHSGNPKLLPILQETLDETAWTPVWRHWCIDYTTTGRRDRSVKIFERLARAIAARDADAAEEQARRHLEDSLAVFLKRIKERASAQS